MLFVRVEGHWKCCYTHIASSQGEVVNNRTTEDTPQTACYWGGNLRPSTLNTSRTAFSSSQNAALPLTFKQAKISFSFSSSVTIYLHLHPQQPSWHPPPHIQHNALLQVHTSHPPFYCLHLVTAILPVCRMNVGRLPSGHASLLLFFREEISPSVMN